MNISLDLIKFTNEFSDFLNAKNAIDITKLSILDWAAVGIRGKDETVSKVVFELISSEGGVKESFLFGSRLQFPARAAALLNGVTSHALDYDDTSLEYLGHPSVVVNSAVFALANKIDLSLNFTIQCSLIGCEVASRVGAWLGRAHYSRGFHITATSGVFGAALGSSRALGLSEVSTRNALNLAASRASGLKAQFGSMAKPYHAGMASSSGLEVAMLASSGMDANKNAFDGEYGFGSVYGRNSKAIDMNFSNTDFLFTKVKHKFHACCHGTHAAIEALTFLQNKYQFQKNEVKKVVVTVHPRFATVCNIQEPKSGLEIKFSYRMLAAMKIFGYDTARLDSYSDKICFNKELTEFRKKIEVNFDEDLKEFETKVEVWLNSGKKCVKNFDLNSLNDFSKLESQVRTKAKKLVGHFTEEKIWSMLQDPKVSSNTFMRFLCECS